MWIYFCSSQPILRYMIQQQSLQDNTSYQFVSMMAESRQGLSFSVANILGERHSCCEDTAAQEQRCNQQAQLKLPQENKMNSTSAESSTAHAQGIHSFDIGSRHSALFEVHDSSRSPLCSPLQSRNSSFASQGLSSSEDNGEAASSDCVSPDALTNSPTYEESDDTHDDIETASPKTKDKPKRGRMRFSPEQIQILERRFQEQHYLLPPERKILSLALQLSERQVKTWFQNKRAQYKRTRPLVRSPVYHTVSPTLGSRSIQQLWTYGSAPSVYSSSAHTVGALSRLRELTLMCTSPTAVSPVGLRSMATLTYPTSPCSVTSTNFLQMSSPSTFKFTYPNVSQAWTLSMSAPK